MSNSKESENALVYFDFIQEANTDLVIQSQISELADNLPAVSSKEELFVESFRERDNFGDINNPIKEPVLLEHEPNNNYNSHSDFKDIFDSKKYQIDLDTNKSIKESVLLEHEPDNNYHAHSDFKGIFDSKKYQNDSAASKENAYEFIIKVPSRALISNENVFSISMKCFKTKTFRSENFLVKIISDNFSFSKSMFQLKEAETSISLTKNKNFHDYNIKVKLYYNNELVQERILDLYKRRYGE